MKITICGSMFFAKEMAETKAFLVEKGHEVFTPERIDLHMSGELTNEGARETAELKIKHDLIRDHYNKINDSDAILVLNYDKKGIKNYIGGNSLIEIAFAYILNKKIYLLNDIPDIEFYKSEIETMQPVILNGDLGKI